jgi:hypothetical protein
MTDMTIHSETAWDIASFFSGALASDTRTLAAMIDDAIAKEREACAKVADRFAADGGDFEGLQRGYAEGIAEQIRARKTT